MAHITHADLTHAASAQFGLERSPHTVSGDKALLGVCQCSHLSATRFHEQEFFAALKQTITVDGVAALVLFTAEDSISGNYDRGRANFDK